MLEKSATAYLWSARPMAATEMTSLAAAGSEVAMRYSRLMARRLSLPAAAITSGATPKAAWALSTAMMASNMRRLPP
ncbi:hypothetical protein D3C78_1713510 [compost metagenome]